MNICCPRCPSSYLHFFINEYVDHNNQHANIIYVHTRNVWLFRVPTWQASRSVGRPTQHHIFAKFILEYSYCFCHMADVVVKKVGLLLSIQEPTAYQSCCNACFCNVCVRSCLISTNDQHKFVDGFCR